MPLIYTKKLAPGHESTCTCIHLSETAGITPTHKPGRSACICTSRPRAHTRIEEEGWRDEEGEGRERYRSMRWGRGGGGGRGGERQPGMWFRYMYVALR